MDLHNGNLWDSHDEILLIPMLSTNVDDRWGSYSLDGKS
jgi:hypothetical protein